MNKFTPGPWQVDETTIGTIETQSGLTIAQAMQVKPLRDDIKSDERKANARLIAAAPELLTALKECAAICAGETLSKSSLIHALEQARAAIAKATGEQP